MDDGSPALEVGFVIDTGGSYDNLNQLSSMMDTVEARIAADAERIERATTGMVNTSAATASITALAATTSAAFGKAELAAERMTARLNEQIETFGMSRAAIVAWRAEQAGATDAAEEVLAAEARLNAVREDSAAKLRSATQAYNMFEAAARRGMQTLRDSEAAERAAEIEREAQALRSAALASAMFEAAARRGAQAMRDQDAAARAAEIEQEAQALRSAALASAQFEAAARRGMQAMRDQQAAEAAASRETEALAAAANRLRASLDPAIAAQQRFDAEMGQARQLIGAGAISLDEYCAKLRQEQTIQRESAKGHSEAETRSNALRYAYQDLGFQIQDVGASLSTVSGPAGLFRIFAQQSGQVFDALNRIAMAGGTASKGVTETGTASEKAGTDLGDMGEKVAGVAEKVENTGSRFSKFAGFMAGPWGAAITVGLVVLGPLVGKLLEGADAADTMSDHQKALADVIDQTTGRIKEQSAALLLNAAAMSAKDAKEAQSKADAARTAVLGYGSTSTIITGAPGAAPLVNHPDARIAAAVGAFAAGGSVDDLARRVAAIGKASPALKGLTDEIITQGAAFVTADRQARQYQAQVRLTTGQGRPGDQRMAVGNFGPEAPDLSMADAKAKLAAATTDVQRAQAQETVTRLAGTKAVNEGRMTLSAYQAQLAAATSAVYRAQAAEKAASAAQRAANKEAHHEDQLAREAAAIDAQVRNLYALASAYQVSGAAALIAEARVKGESAAIKARGDVEAAVNRQVQLAVAQRVADGEKSSAAMQDQAKVQEQVNATVEAGQVSAARAAEMVRDRMADLPLLAAIEAAQQRGLKTEADAATDALERQRTARLRLSDAENRARLDAAIAGGNDQLAYLREEARLIGVTDAARVHALATLKAEQEARANNWTGKSARDYVIGQVAVADQGEANRQAQASYNDQLSKSADLWDLIARNVSTAGQGMADAFGNAGKALGDLAATYAGYNATRERMDLDHRERIKAAGSDQKAVELENQKYALQTSTSQIAAFGDAAAAAKGFFSEGSSGYQALQKAEQTFRAIQFALSVRAMAQDVIETGSSLAKSAARTAAHAVEAVVKAISSLPFPANLVAGAATIAALAAIGVSIAGSFGSGTKPPPSNTGTGTVLGDSAAKSDSIKNAITDLKGVDTLMLTSSRAMQASLKSIDSQIGSFAAEIVKGGDINASSGIATGFKTSGLGSVLSHIPLIGGFLSSLFGTRTDIVGSGLSGSAQTIGQIEANGFAGQSYSDVEKTKKFLGIVTGRSYSTQYGALDPAVSSQFTLILKSFDQAIAAAAGPLGDATGAVQAKLNSFVVDLGRIDLQGLSGDDIEKKLENVFGALGDQMASYVFPEITKFQKVGEGALETLTRVATTVETVTAALKELGGGATALAIDAKMGLASQFDSVSDLTSATDAYFQAFYTKEEQAAAKTAQFADVFASLGLAMPSTLAGFRALVDAQDLTTDAGRATYATLLKLAPAFSDLQTSLNGAKSAADILSERTDLQRQLLEVQGDTAAIRALDLANVDASNRALQQEVWAAQDAKDAASAAQTLADAWKSVGDSIEDEIKRIRGLDGTTTGGTFAQLLGQFNAATGQARGGDQDAAKSLPGLSQSLLTAAAASATSRQELARVQAETAASLETTNAIISRLAGASTAATSAASSTALLAAAATTTQATAAPAAANDDAADAVRALQQELKDTRTDLTAALAAIASSTAKTARTLDSVTAPSGGQAVSTVAA